MSSREIDLAEVFSRLEATVAESQAPQEVLRSDALRELYKQIPKLEPTKRADFGKELNTMKQKLVKSIETRTAELEQASLDPIDVTAPLDVNSVAPSLLPAVSGSTHPLMQEIRNISDIFERMGFVVEESREIDDQFHMFESLNFPEGHPARDEYDTFMTVETDSAGDKFIAPAHTSTMQNRILQKYKSQLEAGEPIAAVVPDRTFRNEDLDARHEHTFYQVEGVYVARDVNVGNLTATLQEFLSEYYGKHLEARINPFYFPFTEPSFEFALQCPFCDGDGSDCKVCSSEGWIELLGCGLIHPNVLDMAGIDSKKYSGFAFGCGIDRLTMMKHAIEDIRHLQSGKLEFLRQFA